MGLNLRIQCDVCKAIRKAEFVVLSQDTQVDQEASIKPQVPYKDRVYTWKDNHWNTTTFCSITLPMDWMYDAMEQKVFCNDHCRRAYYSMLNAISIDGPPEVYVHLPHDKEED